jgi:hypothetical protein
MTRPIPPDIQNAFDAIVKALELVFGDSLIGVYGQTFEKPYVVAVVEEPVTGEQMMNLSKALVKRIGLTIFSATQIQQGHPYESDYAYGSALPDLMDPHFRRIGLLESSRDLTYRDNPVKHTPILRLMGKYGVTLAGHPLRETLPTISDDEYRLALRNEADACLRALPRHPLIILILCRILAFWRVGLILAIHEAGAWGIKNLDPRFQTLIERATTEYQSRSETGAYNAYQLDQFAEYVRDMLKR